MKIKSRRNGLIVEATQSTAEILKLGNGAYAYAISGTETPVEEAPVKKTTRKKPATKANVAKVKAEARAKGIVLNDSQIEGGNVHDEEVSENAVETL